ncbi:class I SAM-dependent methyltransferase [Aliikangiella sp. IMCC44359]|uniref:class I SAM-dependent methyltransferase n=1 Tax=Aliikangiella sp. IMCC44359 TaxID=3459125 RepID=UPI00403A95E8
MKKKINKRLAAIVTLSLLFNINYSLASEENKLQKIVAGEHRTESYAKRDQYRHPVETLQFFGIKDNMTVVEISPGGGWYTEILAPYLQDKGHYIAAGYDPKSKSQYFSSGAKKFAQKLAASPKLYNKVTVGIMQAPDNINFAKDNSADMVLSFRNTHNWHSKGHSEIVYKAIFDALKPGGIFGLVQHRADEKKPGDISGKQGYLKQSDVVALAQKVGFKLVAHSEVNANPKDTKDHPNGVWSLPPVLKEKEKNKQKYLSIGESDRMTLKFIKPKK